MMKSSLQLFWTRVFVVCGSALCLFYILEQQYWISSSWGDGGMIGRSGEHQKTITITTNKNKKLQNELTHALLRQQQHQQQSEGGGRVLDPDRIESIMNYIYGNDTSTNALLELLERISIMDDDMDQYSDTPIVNNEQVAPRPTSTKITSQTKISDDVDSNTGRLFKGHRVRTFSGTRLFRDSSSKTTTTTTTTMKAASHQSETNHNTTTSLSSDTILCKNWGVVTTIFEPSEAVRRIGNMNSVQQQQQQKLWCLVIVADTKTPSGYMKNAGLENKTDTVKYLTVEEQREWGNQERHGQVGAFVNAIPFRHFARKNIGYLYAIQQGAEYIFDFDDDNLVNLDHEGKPVEIVPGKDNSMLMNVSIPILGKKIWNPYPLMEPSVADSWPRGLPLESVLDSKTRGTIQYRKDIPLDKIGVIQYLADGNPDIDAVHRLTKHLPLTFAPESPYMLVPAHAFVPYNAQATVHTKQAFWATLLPFTVPGRVSDIWRSYLAETLFREIGLRVVFGPPRLVQERNEHNILADMDAELDLYFKSSQLIDFLDGWKGDDSLNSLPGLMELLWIDLFEHGYIGENDVQIVQLWLAALAESGYTFPPLQRRHRNVAIMGQFNYPERTERVTLWVQKWKEMFPHVIVRGPFNESSMEDMVSHNIDAYAYTQEEFPGFLSPMDNLAATLMQFQGHDEVEAVLYTHDDGLIQLNAFTNGSSRFRTHEIVGATAGTTKKEDTDLSYMNPRTISDKENAAQVMFKIHRNGTFETLLGVLHDDINKFLDSLSNWGMKERAQCVPGQQMIAMNQESDPYREPDGSILFSIHLQADMLLVPTFVAKEFANATKLFTDANVYLECSAGTIVDMVRQQVRNVTTRVLPLCTKWGGKRGKFEMLSLCLNGNKDINFGAVHPFKMSYSMAKWDQGFDLFTYL